MKRNVITFVTGGVLVLIFALMLFVFQVRQTQYAVVTTFGEYSRSITNAGFQPKLPWPIQNVYKFDNRIQTFEPKYEQTTTSDAINILVSVYTGWRIEDPRLFLERFNGSMDKAQDALEPEVRTAKNGVIGRHPFSHLISTNQAEIKFDQIEQEMLREIQPKARNNYGIKLEFLGIKQLGLPESITSAVFDRMRAERQTLVKQFQSDGEKQAKIIRAQADSQANEILANARATAIKINGEAEAKASEYYQIFEKNRELANFLFQIKALLESTKDRTTIILDQQTTPFNLLNSGGATAAPTGKPE